MLLYLDDKSLNKYLPLKALAPYREGYVVPGYKKKRLLSEFQREVDRKKREAINEMKRKKEIEDSNKSFLQRKKHKDNNSSNANNAGNKKNKNDEEGNSGSAFVGNNKQDFRKKKRMETYGITD